MEVPPCLHLSCRLAVCHLRTVAEESSADDDHAKGLTLIEGAVLGGGAFSRVSEAQGKLLSADIYPVRQELTRCRGDNWTQVRVEVHAEDRCRSMSRARLL